MYWQLQFTVGDDETTRMRYPVPVNVPEGMVAEILCDPDASEVIDCKVTGAANEPEASDN